MCVCMFDCIYMKEYRKFRDLTKKAFKLILIFSHLFRICSDKQQNYTTFNGVSGHATFRKFSIICNNAKINKKIILYLFVI